MINDFIYFKSPSEEKIKQRLSKLSLEERFELGVRNNNEWLVKQCLEEGIDLSKINWSPMWVKDYMWFRDSCLKFTTPINKASSIFLNPQSKYKETHYQ
jgi:hypothetical protein